MSLRESLERAFEAWGRFAVRHAVTVVAVALAATAALAVWLPEVRIDNSTEGLLHPRDPVRVLYDRFREQFGQGDQILVAVATPEVFDLGFLARLRELHRELERDVPFVAEVTSLVNARWTRGEGDELIVEELLGRWPRDAAEVEALRRRVLANPLYLDTLVDAEGRIAALAIEPQTWSSVADDAEALAGFDDTPGDERPPLLTAAESREMLAAIDAVVARHSAPDFEIYVAGAPVAVKGLTEASIRDGTRFIAGSMLAICLILAVLFRRISGVALPLLIVTLSFLSTAGLMVLIGIPASATVQMVATLLLTVGVCDSVHILTITYTALAAGRSKEAAIVHALGHSALPVVFTSVTTAAGLASFATADLAPIADVGVVAPIGVMLALVYTVVLLPALLALAPIERSRHTHRADRLGRLLAAVGDAGVRRPISVVIGAAIVVAWSALGIARLRIEQDAIRWFPEDHPVRIASEFVDREFGGTFALEVLVDTGVENGLHDPALLADLEAATHWAEAQRQGPLFVGKAVSIVDLVKEIHRALNGNRPQAYRLPEERNLVAQELLLFEARSPDDLAEFADARLQTARVTLRMPDAEAFGYAPFLRKLAAGMGRILGDGVALRLTGLPALFSHIYESILSNTLRSYALALVVITPITILAVGRLGRGLVAMIPNLLPVFFILGFMGWSDIPLDTSNLLIGGIILGLAVDDTIHFMHQFQRYFARTGSAREAVRETLTTTGAAMLTTSLTLAAGFFVIAGASMRNAANYGLLAGIATLVAFVADVVLGPALMALVVGARRSPGDRVRWSRIESAPHE